MKRKRPKRIKGEHKYRCVHCKKEMLRVSDKAWIRGYCSETGRDVHLMRVRRK